MWLTSYFYQDKINKLLLLRLKLRGKITMHFSFTKVLSAFLFCLLVGCAAPRLALSNSQITELQSNQLQQDEALIAIKLQYTSSYVLGGVLNFHYDGAEEVRSGIFTRSPGDWTPMFSIHTSQNNRLLLFKVKAGRLSWTQFNRGMFIGDLKNQLNTYAPSGFITYIGDVEVILDPQNGTRFKYTVKESEDSLSELRVQHQKLIAKYPLRINLLKKDL